MTRLADVATEADWRDYHRIRRTVLWEARGRLDYDENHPDDLHPSNHPLLLMSEEYAIGTVRIDDNGDRTGVVRLVAITPDRQRAGHGRELSRLIEMP